MKVLIVNGQNHKGSTYRIGRQLAEKVTSPENISEIFLPHDFGEFCIGCNNCFLKGEDKCPHYAKLKPVTDLIDNSDILIFTTPTYVYHATGQMKAILDHYGWRWMVHRPEEKMFYKKAVVISTAAGAGTKSAVKDIADSCFAWGIPEIYRIGIAVRATSWEEVPEKIKNSIDRKTDCIAAKLKRPKGRVKVPIKQKLFFEAVRKIHQNDGMSPFDKAYWQQKQWLARKRPWKNGGTA